MVSFLSRAQLESRKYKSLQKLAKRHEIKGKRTSESIIRKLVKKFPDGVPDYGIKKPRLEDFGPPKSKPTKVSKPRLPRSVAMTRGELKRRVDASSLVIVDAPPPTARTTRQARASNVAIRPSFPTRGQITRAMAQQKRTDLLMAYVDRIPAAPRENVGKRKRREDPDDEAGSRDAGPSGSPSDYSPRRVKRMRAMSESPTPYDADDEAYPPRKYRLMRTPKES